MNIHAIYPCFALIELNSQSNIYQNLIAIEKGVIQAVQHGAKLIVLPENAFCFGNQQKTSQYFEALKNWCSKLAEFYQVYFLAGTLPCPYRPDGSPVADGKFRQTSLLFEPSGNCIARYDKIHLFKATVNDTTGSYDESRVFEAGNELVVAKTEFANIGMMICFDLRFPQLAIRLRQLGAEIITAPSAFTYQTGKAHWRSLLTARALDSQCLLIGAGQSGTHSIERENAISERETWGHSEFINANGEIVTSFINMSLTDTSILPMVELANSWLTDIKENSDFSVDYQVLFTNFDIKQQRQWRENIALMDCQRLAVAENLTL